MTDINRELSIMIIWHGGDCVLQNRTHKLEGGVGFYGGKRKVGETALAAAIRETEEELGKRFTSEQVSMLGQLEINGWLVNVAQAAVSFGEELKSKEGEAIYCKPFQIPETENVMDGSLAATKEYILLKPDDTYRVTKDEFEVVNG